MQSRHAGWLVGAPGCDPTHLNFAHVLGEDAAACIAPGDLVASLRNLSAFAIFDKHDQRLKRFVRDSFYRQHGVRHLQKAKFVLFDNFGADAAHGPARLLTVDLATGRETTVFRMTRRRNICAIGSRWWMGRSTFPPTGAASCLPTRLAPGPWRFDSPMVAS